MPVVWLIDAYRAGERGQVRALADALGYPYATKSLSYRGAVVLPHVLGRASASGISRKSRATLTPPWPDLVISSGVRNEPVCRWIRERSGGHTLYVHVGRPWGPLASFDLVITTPQYRVPDHPRVLRNPLTLNSIDPQRLAEAGEQWAEVFTGLPAPRIAVLVGGDSGPFTLGPRAAARLGEQAAELAAQTGGSLMVTTSSRTRQTAVDALAETISPLPHHLHRWQPGGGANPYLGMLAWADRLVVTGDSIAMLSEACATGKPVQIFDLGGMQGKDGSARDFRLGASLYAALMRWGWQRLSRDITLVHRLLVESGRAAWLGDEVQAPAATAGDNSDLERSVLAVRRLLGDA